MPTPHFDPFLPRMEDLLRASILPMISFQILKFIWKPCLFSVDSSVCFDRLYVCLVQKKLCVFCIYVFIISCMYVLCMVCFVYIYVVPNFSHRLLVDMAAMGKVSGHVQDIKALRMNCTFICICICIVFIFVACICIYILVFVFVDMSTRGKVVVQDIKAAQTKTRSAILAKIPTGENEKLNMLRVMFFLKEMFDLFIFILKKKYTLFTTAFSCCNISGASESVHKKRLITLDG